MTARILVVDDIPANSRLLEAKLSAEYFDVETAINGIDAIEAVKRSKPDIVLLDVMMPGMDGLEVCRRIKGDSETRHIPVIMVTALDQPGDRVSGLQAGADDFLTKPVNDLALLCRVKSLVKLKMLTDGLRGLLPKGEIIRLIDRIDEHCPAGRGNVLVIERSAAAGMRIQAALERHHRVEVLVDPLNALGLVMDARYDLIIISLEIDHFDGLRLCSQLKSLEPIRQTPILVVIGPNDYRRLIQALDMGVDDYLIRPIDKQELLARTNTQVRRSRYYDQLRSHVQAAMKLAITDPLTEFHNRRYFESQAGDLVKDAIKVGKSLSLLVVDIDHFKSVNDEHGHAAGDRVLQQMASRLKDSMRTTDMACRTGGEEFVIILPNTDADMAVGFAELMRLRVSGVPFQLGSGVDPLTVTVSIGVATARETDTIETILKRADLALYAAKRGGRDRVVYRGI